MEEDVVEDYKSSLRDLNCNSKPLINMLTMLAEDNVNQAPKIVQVIESHLARVGPDVKLPVMYLIDSIIKNVGQTYLQLFTQNIVSVFCSVFEKVDEKTRMQLFKLRQTWSEIFPQKKMYAIDVRVQSIDPAWPVLTPQPAIHINPKFLETKQPVRMQQTPALTKQNATGPAKLHSEDEVQQQLIAKQAELLRLQQQRIQLDLLRLKESLQTPRTQPTPQTNAVSNKDPRLARRDPRLGATQRMNFRDPRLDTRQGQSQLTSVVVPTAQPSVVDSVSKDRTTMPRHVTTHITPDPKSAPKKVEFPKRDVIPPSKDSKSISSVVKVPPMCSPTKEPSQPFVKHTEQKTNDKTSPKSKAMGGARTNNSKAKEKVLVNANETVSAAKTGTDKLDSPSKKKANPDDKNKKKGTPEKGSPEVKDGKRKDNKKRSPKSPSKNDKNKTRDTSPNNKKSDRKGGRKSPIFDTKTKSGGVEVNLIPVEIPRKEQAQDVDLRVLQQKQQQAIQQQQHQAKDIDIRTTEILVTKDHEKSREIRPQEEPPNKKAKIDRVDSLFGVEDQDYRMLNSKFSDDDEDEENEAVVDRIPMDRPRQKNWAQYKEAHPDEFKSPLRPSKENIQGPVDQDFRIQPFVHPQDPKTQGFDRLGRPLLSRMNRRPSFLNCHKDLPPEDQERLILSREQEILHEADQHLRTGLISPHDHKMVVARFGALRSRFPQEALWSNSAKDSPPSLENGNSPLHNDVCPNMSNRLPPSKPILIDNKMRNIKFYGERAIVEMDDGNPYQITFTGTPRMVFLDGKEIFFLSFGESRDFVYHGRHHKIKFGTPSREVYLDGKPYAATFGGESFPVVLDGAVRQMKLGGPPPNVELSSKPVQDLCDDQSPPGSREDMLDVDMRDAFQAPRGKSPVMDDMNPPAPDEQLKDVDMRVPMSVPQRQLMPPEGGSNIPLGDQPHPDPYLQQQPLPAPPLPPQLPNSLQPPPLPPVLSSQMGPASLQQKQSQGLGSNWDPPSWGRGQEFRSSPGQEWGSPARDQGHPADGPQQDWHSQKDPMDWECKGSDQQQQQRLKFQTFRPDEVQWRENQKKKNSEWDWRQEYSNSNSPHRYDEYPPMQGNQGMAHHSPGHPGPIRDTHMQGHMVGPHHGPTIHGSHSLGGHSGPRQMGGHPNQQSVGPPHQGPHPPGPHPQGHLPPGPHPGVHMGGMHQGPMPDMGHIGNAPHPDRMQDVSHQGPQHMGPQRQGLMPPTGPLLQNPDGNHQMGQRMGPRGFVQFGAGSVQHQHYQTAGMRLRFPAARYPQERPSGMPFPGPPRFRPHHERPKFIQFPPKDMDVRGPLPGNVQPDVQNLAVPDQPQDPQQTAPPALDVTSLLSKLIASGLITSSSNASAKEDVPEQDQSTKEIPPIDLAPECLKTRHPGVIVALYTGMQCASCGMRFQDCQQEKYSQHLDWHFRSNRREKDGVKKAFSRKWFYDVEDWVQFEELEDLEDRAPSLFEIQADEDQFQTASEPVEQPSVIAHEDSADNVCVVCSEPLELIWVEEAEEWHLKGAVRHGGKTYHPLCYQDFQKAQLAAAETPTEPTPPASSEKVVVIKIEPEDPPEEPSEETLLKSDDDQTAAEAADESKEDENEETNKAESNETKVDNNDENKEEEEMETNNEDSQEYHLEEEIIGVINSENEDMGYEDDLEDGEIRPEPEMVVMQSGGITLKVRAESIAMPSASTSVPSPVGSGNTNTESGSKDDTESGEVNKSNALDETDTEDEFVPPPPDPRFQVLAPVQRGKELSGLCSIM